MSHTKNHPCVLSYNGEVRIEWVEEGQESPRIKPDQITHVLIVLEKKLGRTNEYLRNGLVALLHRLHPELCRVLEKSGRMERINFAPYLCKTNLKENPFDALTVILREFGSYEHSMIVSHLTISFDISEAKQLVFVCIIYRDPKSTITITEVPCIPG